MVTKEIPIIGIDRLRFSSDGDGIRTLIGTYGCPLRCRYCLNPQSWNGSIKPKYYTPEQLCEKVSIDSIYFQATGGGITIGGGEPLLYMEGISAFVRYCPQSWNFWVETSLNVNPEVLQQASRVFCHFIVDIKSTNPAVYKAYTGSDLLLAMNNLLLLKELVGAERITVRVPFIPGFTDSTQQQTSVIELTRLGFKNIDTFTYRTDINEL